MKLQRNNILAGIAALFAFAGFIDATYLTVKHYLGGPLTCVFFKGCDVVTNSVYSQIAGVPISLLGALYYLAIIIMIVVYFDRKNLKVLRFAAKLTILGFIASLILIYLMAFVLKAGCIYCVISAISSTLLFITGMVIVKLTNPNQLAS